MSAGLVAAIESVEELHERAKAWVGPFGWEDRTWQFRNRETLKALADLLKARHGAKIRDDFNGARVSMLGIAATSTSGLSGAVTNWLRSARTKAGQA